MYCVQAIGSPLSVESVYLPQILRPRSISLYLAGSGLYLFNFAIASVNPTLLSVVLDMLTFFRCVIS